MTRLAFALGLLLSLAGCRAAAKQDDATGEPRFVPRTHVYGFVEHVELGELRIEDNLSGEAIDARDVEHDRVGVGFELGGRVGRAYFEVFYDELGSGAEPFQGGGIGLGATGDPSLVKFSDDFRLFLPYLVTFDFVYARSNAGLLSDLNLFYFEPRTNLGLGLDWRGLRPSVGFEARALVGEATSDFFDLIGDTATLTALNAGAYGSLAYRHPDFPLGVELRGYAGDLSGFVFKFGGSW